MAGVMRKTRSDKQQIIKCARCSEDLPRSAFNKCQLKRKLCTSLCLQCTAGWKTRNGRRIGTLACIQCFESKPSEAFPPIQRYHSARPMCLDCCRDGSAQPGRPQRQASFDVGALDQKCRHCGAVLYSAEPSTFCCGHGKFAIDFNQYFQSPSAALLRIMSRTWPVLTAAGDPVLDFRTRKPQLQGFSAVSRRYNALFSLAQHEIQSLGQEREVHLNTWGKPANVRIHGTMYRKVH